MSAGIGTHLDAPRHCFANGLDIANLSLDKLITPCVMIDFSANAHESYCISKKDIQNFENSFGKINPNCFVILHTGWSQFWNDAEKYRNNLHFPTVSIEAAEYLLEKNIVGLGVDTLSPDNESQGFPVHRLLLGANKYIIENVANAIALPEQGSLILALPLKIEGGTESPVRLLAAFQCE
jgi:kynurenine formamidase